MDKLKSTTGQTYIKERCKFEGGGENETSCKYIKEILECRKTAMTLE